MNFLITGGAGFIGAALANQLVRAGHSVRALDDLSAGDNASLDARVLFTRGDVRDVPKLWGLLRGVDCVYHLAARVSVPESVLYPVEYNAVNVGGTVALMTAMRDAGVRRVILASSGAAYGEQTAQPVCENAVMHPTTPYAVSKLAAEYYVHAIGALSNIESVALRIFNAYGPQQQLPPSHAPVIPRFLQAALSGGSLVIFGDGKQSRDFVYLDDVVTALERAATAQNINRAIINIGSGADVTMDQLVDTIDALLQTQTHRLYNQEASAGVSRLVADISLAQKLLDWTPQISLRQGLAQILERDVRFQLAAS
ncbi:MAG: UDP-N-acetylglucosamine 4-epimerase [Anaerolineae bacterium]|nr:UDP-N-acetylglucosamine 4-epimerase [Anaerolineae bacterium]RIK29397.1 MAG: epimerase [Chloroflexota bacterium]